MGRNKCDGSPIVEKGANLPIRYVTMARVGRSDRSQISRRRYLAVVLSSLTMTFGLALLAQPAGASSAEAAPHSSTAPPWQIQKTPVLKVKDGEFNGISCATVSNCVAVGDRLNSKGAEVALAQVWNGTSWSITKTISPAGAEQSELSGVSCASASDCLAVGQSDETPLAESWDGTSWTLQNVTTKDILASLSSVSCPSADLCRAVGYGLTEKGGESVLAESWNGTTWTQTRGPKVSGVETTLGSVSCSSADDCEAVGISDSESGEVSTLAESWTAKGLVLQQTPNPKGSTYSELNNVSCVSASDCVAVGFAIPNTLTETWNGSDWSIVPTPEPAGSVGAELFGVSCTSSTACMGVGGYASSSGADDTLTMTWSGKAWTIEPSPSPSSTENGFLGVSCNSASACTAAGAMVGTKSPALLLVEVWDGTNWSTQHAFLKRAELGAGLYSVSCTSTSFCLAVGSDELQDPIAEIWNGTDWKLTPAPAENGGGGFTDVACITATDCVAVGAPDTEQDGLAEQWNGKTWTVLQTPAGEGELESVSCTSATACIAVGTTYAETGPAPLAESWNGTQWSLMKTPAAGAGAEETELLADSCGSAQSCVAVGVSVSYEDVGSPLIESWNGTKWSLDESAPTSAVNLGLTGVSCTSGTSCMATGYSFDRLDSPVAFSEVWNGTTWAAAKIPSGSGGTVLYGLQCSSASSCVTVGGDGNGALAERWDGKAWTVLKPVNPPGSGTSTFLVGVDCTSSKACTAVGDYANTQGLEQTLAEAN